MFEILTGHEETNVKLECSIKKIPEKKANDFFKIIVDWVANENHVFTRIGLFRLLPELIDAMPKKKQLLDLVTPTLIKFWLKTGVELRSEQMGPRIIAALKHRGKEARFSACDFLAKATMLCGK